MEDYSLHKESFAQTKGSIEGEVYFNDNSQLDFNEVVNTHNHAKEKYAYHYMNKSKELIFRYDNVKHHPEVKTFPHHKHTPTGLQECKEPNIGTVLSEIEKVILDNYSNQ